MKLRKLLCLACFMGLFFSKGALTKSGVLEKGDDEPVVPSSLYSSWVVIPTAVNKPGRYGAYFSTRVVMHNLTSEDFSIEALLLGPTGPVSRRNIRMAPDQYLSMDNFLQQVFDVSGEGAVILRVGEEVPGFYVTAEVYTDSPKGRSSTTVVNGFNPPGIEATRGFHAGITANASQRVNIGALSLIEYSSIQARVFDSHGSLLEIIEFEMAPLSWQQKTIGVPVENGSIRWEITGYCRILPSGSDRAGEASEAGFAHLWAVSVDNRSNDGTLTWAVPGRNPDISQ